ncbi:uncharacterized protein LOC143880955 [Tasmannia lanceolata]|uniref:uncharacterized protein LOC143880955 n=1 Tax=Tasmannia lanceolata TaxID=3420 RepID=UPI004062B0EE
MGNCLVLQENVIKIMKVDGKILEYKPPLKVHQVLSEFSGHLISDELPVLQNLRPETKMRSGCLYYLLPPPLPSIEDNRKALEAKNPVTNIATVAGEGMGVVRIRVVVTKQELKDMLTKEGVSVDDVISYLQKKPTIDDAGDDDNGSSEGYRGWRPVLESIPEGTDFN